MSKSVSSPLQGGAAPGGVSLTSELTARLQAHARGLSSQSSGQPSFAQIMTQQELSLQRSAEPKAPEKKPERQSGAQAAAAKAHANARLNDQLIARARLRNEVATPTPEAAPKPPIVAKSVEEVPADNEPQANVTVKDVVEPAVKREQPTSESASAEVVEAPAKSDGAKEAVPDGVNMMAWLMNVPVDRKHDLPTATQALQTDESRDQTGDEADQQLLFTDVAAEADVHQQQVVDIEAGALPLENANWQQTAAMVALKGGQAQARSIGVDANLTPALDVSAMAGLSSAQAPKGAGGAFAPMMRHESASLPTPIHHPDFSKAFNDQVRMWVNASRTDGPMTAELHLNPAETGPIQVKIALDGQVAKIDFAAAAFETRRAIEASMAQLSAALGEAGLTFAGGDVSAQTSQQSSDQASRGSRDGQSGLGQSGAEVDLGQEVSAASLQSLRAAAAEKAGGLDLYA